MDNNTQTVVEQPVQPVVENPATAKVSTAEAQRKTAVADQIFYSFAFFVIGIPLAIWGFIWLANMGGTASASKDIPSFTNSVFAMGIVGVILIVWGIASTALAAAFQITNRTNHKISNGLGVCAWFTFNPFSWSMVRQSNGYLSKKQKAKIAKAEAAANSTDSVDSQAE